MTHPLTFAVWIWFFTAFVASATAWGVYRSLTFHTNPRACLWIDAIGISFYATAVALYAYASATGH